MFADIYPWAGQWRTVSLHKGDGPTRWPLPPFGMEPVMEEFARDVLGQWQGVAVVFQHDEIMQPDRGRGGATQLKNPARTPRLDDH